MLLMTYNPDTGKAFKDGETASVVADWTIRLKMQDMSIVVSFSTVNIMNRVRSFVKHGLIDPEQVRFYKITHSDVDAVHIDTITVDKFGMLSSWPDGFCDIDYNVVSDIFELNN